HLSFIQTLAKERGVAVNINKCNPLAGDPAYCYDVDFLPVGTGNDEIARFMLNQYDLSKDQGFAFGDSGNDLRMLHSVTHAFLVQNATVEAKRNHHQ
ncbi:HAD hydrolase family protein, partial [Bacillus pumilus]